jgi:hypothetical protein
MVSNHINNNHSHPDVFTNVMQGKVLFHGNQLPKVIWNQIKIIILSNKDGKETKKKIFFFRFALFRI